MLTLNQLTVAFQHNPILTGGIGMGVGGALLAYVRSLPGLITSLVRRRFITSINVTSSDQKYSTLMEFLSTLESAQKSKLLSARSSWQNNVRTVFFCPAPGAHVFTYKGKRFWISQVRKEAKDGYNAPPEEVTLFCFGLDYKFLRNLVTDAMLHNETVEKYQLSVFMLSGGGDGNWKEFVRKTPRLLDSVVLPDGVVDRLKDDVETFLAAEERYEFLGIPYHRGYMLHGPPGNGKSSIAEALVGALQRNFYVISLASPYLSDLLLLSVISEIPANGVLLIEDIDAVFEGRVNVAGGDICKVTFSGLLNALDGVASKPGQIVIMSTNHIEKLDPALLRPGRSDYKIFIDNATVDQAHKMFLRFFPDHTSLADQFAVENEGKSMAHIQGILAYAKTPESTIQSPVKEPSMASISGRYDSSTGRLDTIPSTC